MKADIIGSEPFHFVLTSLPGLALAILVFICIILFPLAMHFAVVSPSTIDIRLIEANAIKKRQYISLNMVADLQSSKNLLSSYNVSLKNCAPFVWILCKSYSGLFPGAGVTSIYTGTEYAIFGMPLSGQKIDLRVPLLVKSQKDVNFWVLS